MGPAIDTRANSPNGYLNEQLVNPLQQITEKFTVYIFLKQDSYSHHQAFLTELDNIIQGNASESLTTLPPNHEIITMVRQINVAASQFFVREELALWFAQKLVHLLYKSEISLGIEIYIILLERICELSRRVAKELSMWLLFSDDEV